MHGEYFIRRIILVSTSTYFKSFIEIIKFVVFYCLIWNQSKTKLVN